MLDILRYPNINIDITNMNMNKCQFRCHRYINMNCQITWINSNLNSNSKEFQIMKFIEGSVETPEFIIQSIYWLSVIDQALQKSLQKSLP